MFKNTANATKPLSSSLTDLKSKQQGVVLIVSLVFLVALTAVASVLMLNTSSDMKMSGASQEKVSAIQEAISSIDEVIFIQMKSNENSFTKSQFPRTVNVTPSDMLAKIKAATDTTEIEAPDIPTNILSVDCPSSRFASSTEMFKCNLLRVQVKKEYGRNNTSNIKVNAGIAQQLLNIGG
ncbi:MAG: pilus assembly PilX N-terminal domain-containing protein [Colwellia sp.]|nr:pilus assembly PilX N-terminal domain-containing protein [Colwellia sp.]